MKIKNWFIHYQSMIYMTLGVALIFFIGMLNISKNSSLRIVGDEFGYWTAGATLVGIDWSSVSYYNFYYAYGYGVILAPILLLNVSQTLKYRIAVVINVAMLAIVFLLLYQTIIKKNKHSLHAAFIALAGTLYSSNILYSQFTLAETFILFLYVLSVLSFIAFIQKGKLIHAVLLPMLSGAMFTVHMRTLALLPVLLILFTAYTIWKKNYRALLSFCIAGILVSVSVYLINRWYQQTVITFSDSNQVSGQMDKIATFFTLDGFLRFVVSFLGKTTYTVLASFSIVAITIIRIIRNFFVEWKKGQIRLVTLLGLFLLLNLIAMEAISALSTMDFENRYDLLTYGRYHDFTISILIVYELYMGLIKREKIYLFQLILTCIFVVLLTAITLDNLPEFRETGHLSVFSPGIFLFIENKNHLFFLTLLNLFVLFLYYLFNASLITGREKRNFHIGVLSFLLSGLFILMSFTSLNNVLHWAVPQCTREERLARKIQKDSTMNRVLYYVPDNYINIEYMQFLLNDKTIQCFSDVSCLLDVDQNDCILTAVSSQLINDEWMDEFELRGESICLQYWRKK